MNAETDIGDPITINSKSNQSKDENYRHAHRHVVRKSEFILIMAGNYAEPKTIEIELRATHVLSISHTCTHAWAAR